MNLPGLPVQPLKKELIEIDTQVQSFLNALAGYEPTALYNHCFELLRGLLTSTPGIINFSSLWETLKEI